jgi:hypothetical protein
MTEAELPYNGSSGWSGSDTSQKRAARDDSNGVTSQRQIDTMNLLETKADLGLTWDELAYHFGWHHGQASGALSNLHKTGHILRLVETRNKSHVYVLPEWRLFRDTQEFGRKQTNEIAKIDHTTMGNQYVYQLPDNGQLLVTVFLSGEVHVATRPNYFATWSAPLQCLKSEVLL